MVTLQDRRDYYDNQNGTETTLSMVDGVLSVPLTSVLGGSQVAQATLEAIPEADVSSYLVSWCIEICIPPIWQAAHDYEYKQISGSAIGMLALGVYRGLPKSLAVQAWVSAIWTQYYENKALIEGGTPYADTMTDYSAHGTMPHTVPELRTEVEV